MCGVPGLTILRPCLHFMAGWGAACGCQARFLPGLPRCVRETLVTALALAVAGSVVLKFFNAHRQLTRVSTDTSPRGVPVEGDSDGWDFGTGEFIIVAGLVCNISPLPIPSLCS